ncbi:unnamed protein product [Dibothriocephalus latus]|uniref:Uncharacterized protein n=1 Tax=Dibothriocephalus latus TaxID=60516 RepID=A0A3P6QFY0_DIBLA|nr:unnamed protein product [Dibothriocephalus latus]
MNWDGGNNGNEMDGPQPRQSKRMRVESGPCDQPALSRPKITFGTYLDKPSNQLLDDLQYSGRLPMPNEQRKYIFNQPRLPRTATYYAYSMRHCQMREVVGCRWSR